MFSRKYLTNAAGGLLPGCAAGAISAGIFALSGHWPALGRRDDVVFYSPGIVFGLAISIYCRLSYSRPSLPGIVGFIATCGCTEFAMVLLAGLTMMAHPALGIWIGFLAAGTIGAFLVLSAALFLLFKLRGVQRILRTAFYWSAIGGILAVLAWAFGFFGSSLLRRWTGISASPIAPFELVFFAWQAGIGLVIGIIVHKEIGPAGPVWSGRPRPRNAGSIHSPSR